MSPDRDAREIRTVAAVVAQDEARPCSCGHGRAAHEHYRRGTDCSLCGCGRFTRSSVRERVTARLARRLAGAR